MSASGVRSTTANDQQGRNADALRPRATTASRPFSPFGPWPAVARNPTLTLPIDEEWGEFGSTVGGTTMRHADKGRKPKGSVAFGPCPARGLDDESRDLVGMREHRHVARRQFDRLGAHALGHEALEVRVDGAVLGG